MINKADSADPIELEGLQLSERQSVVVSARTGDGIDGLQAEIERLLPRHFREVRVMVPYDRGDLLSRAHDEGEVLTVEHGGDRDGADRQGSARARRRTRRVRPVINALAGPARVLLCIARIFSCNCAAQMRGRRERRLRTD